MKRHSGTELERFLVAMDDALNERAPVIVIGGSALILGYGVFAATSDIDVFGGDIDAVSAPDAIQVAARRAR